MSYSDAHHARSAKPIVAVAALHAIIAYGFISGLAYEVIPYIDPLTSVRQIPDDTPPPPKALPQPPRAIRRTTLAAPEPIVRRPDLGGDVIVVPTFDPGARSEPDPQLLPPSAPLSRSSQARRAGVIGDRAAWVTTDDYPSAALREGVEGSVEIDVTIGADGRVNACDVTRTSGNALLDQQTCRIYARRARFSPALDAEGRPTATHRADRVRWQMPAQ